MPSRARRGTTWVRPSRPSASRTGQRQREFRYGMESRSWVRRWVSPATRVRARGRARGLGRRTSAVASAPATISGYAAAWSLEVASIDVNQLRELLGKGRPCRGRRPVTGRPLEATSERPLTSLQMDGPPPVQIAQTSNPAGQNRAKFGWKRVRASGLRDSEPDACSGRVCAVFRARADRLLKKNDRP